MKKLGGIFVPPYTAVIHQYMRECAAGGGRMILGSDSHTRYGCLGTMGIGEGGTEIARQALGSTYDIRRPPVIAVKLSGAPVPGVGPMDVALTLIGAVFDCGFCKNKILEVVGDGIANLSMEYRMGIDVMTTETAALSSIWMTDETVREWLAIHGREDAYEKLEPTGDALYDGLIEIDLSSMEPMIALPFHPSNVYSIRELCRDRAYLDGVLESVEKDAYMRSGLTYTLRDKIKNKRLMVQQASIAGCAGGTFDNIAAVADILDGYKISGDGISLGIYPASQPVFLETMRQGVAERLLLSGVTIRPCICGPCFGTVDVPANNTLGIRHVSRNYYSREGSKTDSGQLSATALMDARSIASTVRNGGLLTAATEMDTVYRKFDYHFENTIYRGGVYNGFGCPNPCIHVPKGPNIKDWPEMSQLTDNILLKVCSKIMDPVTTTDELIPSGETSSYRSNPLGLAEFTLSRRDPEYVGRSKEVDKIEKSRIAGEKLTEIYPELTAVYDVIRTLPGQSEISPEETETGSMIYAVKPGDGSAREQAASCQRVIGGLANITKEYATKRYRSNVMNWGMIPFQMKEEPEFEVGDYIFVPGVRQVLDGDMKDVKAYVIKDGVAKEISLYVADMTPDERKIVKAGCLINYNRARRK